MEAFQVWVHDVVSLELLAWQWNGVGQDWALLGSDKSVVYTSCELVSDMVGNNDGDEHRNEKGEIFADFQDDDSDTIFHPYVSTDNS